MKILYQCNNTNFYTPKKETRAKTAPFETNNPNFTGNGTRALKSLVLAAVALAGSFTIGSHIPKAPISEEAAIISVSMTSTQRAKIDMIENVFSEAQEMRLKQRSTFWNNFPKIYEQTMNQSPKINHLGLAERGVEGLRGFYKEYPLITSIACKNEKPWEEIKTQEEAIGLIDETINEITDVGLLDYWNIGDYNNVNLSEYEILNKVIYGLSNNKSPEIQRVANIYKEEIALAVKSSEQKRNMNNFKTRLENDSDFAYKEYLLNHFSEIKENADRFKANEAYYETINKEFAKAFQPTSEATEALYQAYTATNASYNALIRSLNLETFNDDIGINSSSFEIGPAVTKAHKRIREKPTEPEIEINSI